MNSDQIITAHDNSVKLRLWPIAVFIVLITVAVWSLFDLRTLRDWYILAVYKPPAEIVDIAKTDTMTSYARQLFYVNRPQISSKQLFAQNCPNGTEQSYVVGCYHAGDNGIYLLNVTDPRLNGIVEVTGAYEMLHAGYARLTNQQRNLIDQRMWTYYQSHDLGTEIKQQMAAYAKTEPGEQYDELYSVLATEVSDLPINLENQYRIYFTDRRQVVDMYNGYEAAFTERQAEIKADDNQLTTLKKQIQTEEGEISTLLANIQSDQNVLTSDKAQGRIADYNAEVVNYNDIVNSYDSLIVQIKSVISSYNGLVNSRNKLALEEQQLIQDINANPGQTINKK